VRLHRVALGPRERGQVVVFFALLLPVILGLGSVVVSVGNWYVHKKHLQTLVDAGAFAGGQEFTGCGQDPAGTNADIAAAALKYAGDPNRDATTENRQLEDPLDAHVVLNSTNYWPGAGTATDGTGYDYTNVSTAADARSWDNRRPRVTTATSTSRRPRTRFPCSSSGCRRHRARRARRGSRYARSPA
jgi:uncharacterized membrane protein